MPDGIRSFALDREHAQQSESRSRVGISDRRLVQVPRIYADQLRITFFICFKYLISHVRGCVVLAHAAETVGAQLAREFLDR